MTGGSAAGGSTTAGGSGAAAGGGPATLATAMADRAGDDRPGLRFEGRTWTWRQIVAASARWATILGDLTPDPDRPAHVGVLLENVPEFLFLLGASVLSGRVLVALNPTRRGEELARDVRHTDCAVVVTDAEHRALLQGLDLGGSSVVSLEDLRPAAEATAAGTGAPDEVTATVRRAAEAMTGDELRLLLFTSGSTGAPKAVRVSDRRLAGAGIRAAIRDDDVVYCAMPLFHGNALFSSVAPAIGVGATIVLRRRFSASAFAPEVADEGCTFAATVGRALAHVVSQPPSPDEGRCRLRWVLAPESAPADVEAFERRFGCPVVTGYGSSENAVVLVPVPGMPPDALGVALRGLDVDVVDPDTGEPRARARFDGHGRLTNPEEAVGEIVGRNVLGRFEGYYRNEEATTQRVRGGWYWTGDLGYVDDGGVFYFAGRTTDWLRVDSENFAAGPVERIVARFPGVRGVAVFGVPDERTADDQVMAVLELDAAGEGAATFDPAAFERFLAEQPDLGTKWAPRYVRVVDRLPVSGVAKVDKAALRRAGWDGPAVWWRPERGAPLRPMTAEDRAGLAAALAARHRASR